VGKLHSNKTIRQCNVMAYNMKWEGCLMHIAIYNLKATLRLMGGWLAFCGDFPIIIRGSWF
jgi:hypothetical protein